MEKDRIWGRAFSDGVMLAIDDRGVIDRRRSNGTISIETISISMVSTVDALYRFPLMKIPGIRCLLELVALVGLNLCSFRQREDRSQAPAASPTLLLGLGILFGIMLYGSLSFPTVRHVASNPQWQRMVWGVIASSAVGLVLQGVHGLLLWRRPTHPRWLAVESHLETASMGLFLWATLGYATILFSPAEAEPERFLMVASVLFIIVGVLGYQEGVKAIGTLGRKMADLVRFHGAEHQVVHAIEQGLALEPTLLQTLPTTHPGCGSVLAGGLLVAFLLGYLLLIGVRPPIPQWVTCWVIPLVLMDGMRWLAERWEFGRNLFLWPGLQLQRIVARRPSLSQLQVAIQAAEVLMEPFDTVGSGQ